MNIQYDLKDGVGQAISVGDKIVYKGINSLRKATVSRVVLSVGTTRTRATIYVKVDGEQGRYSWRERRLYSLRNAVKFDWSTTNETPNSGL